LPFSENRMDLFYRICGIIIINLPPAIIFYFYDMENIVNKIHSTVPVISTGDIEKSIDYYITVLGFLFDFKYGEPLVYAGVKCGGAEIYFTHDTNLASAIKEKKYNPEVFIWIEDAENFYKEHVSKGAEVVEPVSARPWGSIQYVIKDINGYHLKFAQPL
jgi:uncharacterized glyoxalase superfamily protein PhnB